MDTSRDSRRPNPRARLDLVLGGGLVTVAVVGRLLWQASDLGLVSAVGTR